MLLALAHHLSGDTGHTGDCHGDDCNRCSQKLDCPGLPPSRGQSLVVTVIVSMEMQMDDVLEGLGPKEDRSSAAGLIQPARLVGEGKTNSRWPQGRTF